MEIISTAVVWQISKAIYSMINSPSSLFESKAKEQLQIAYNYLNSYDAGENLIRMALQHMETAYTMLEKEPFINADKRIKQLNDLCFYISKLHYELGDSYESTTNYWARKTNKSIYPPEGFRDILKEADWIYLIDAYNNYINPAPSPIEFDPNDIWLT